MSERASIIWAKRLSFDGILGMVSWCFVWAGERASGRAGGGMDGRGWSRAFFSFLFDWLRYVMVLSVSSCVCPFCLLRSSLKSSCSCFYLGFIIGVVSCCFFLVRESFFVLFLRLSLLLFLSSLPHLYFLSFHPSVLSLFSPPPFFPFVSPISSFSLLSLAFLSFLSSLPRLSLVSPNLFFLSSPPSLLSLFSPSSFSPLSLAFLSLCSPSPFFPLVSPFSSSSPLSLAFLPLRKLDWRLGN